MIVENKKKSIIFVRIVAILKFLRAECLINEEEYKNAKEYYQDAIGADIVIAD